jgi:FkbM family methyltransferase
LPLQGPNSTGRKSRIATAGTKYFPAADERYPKPHFIKIDVEGAELLVLRGGSEAFKRGFRPLMLIELFAPWQHAFG